MTSQAAVRNNKSQRSLDNFMAFNRILALAILQQCTSKLVTATEQCDTYQFIIIIIIINPFYPGESCKVIYDLNPQTHNRSGYYQLINPLHEVYCYMEQQVVCGNISG